MVSDSLAKEFQRLLGKEQVFLQEADRLTYAYDAAVLEPVLPALVVRPKSTELLGQVVRLCNDHGLPLTVRGAGHESERRHHSPPRGRGGADQCPQPDSGNQRRRPVRRGPARGDHRQAGPGGGSQGAVLSA